MKKVFVYLILCTIGLVSCNKAEEPEELQAAQGVFFELDGTDKILMTPTVDRMPTITVTFINVSVRNAAGDEYRFYLPEGETGDFSAYPHVYREGQRVYNSGTDFRFIVTKNSNRHLQATFSGTVNFDDGSSQGQSSITNGLININY